MKNAQNAVRSEMDKMDEVRRSAMRASVALLRCGMDAAATSGGQPPRAQALVEFQTYIRANGELAALCADVEKDTATANLLRNAGGQQATAASDDVAMDE